MKADVLWSRRSPFQFLKLPQILAFLSIVVVLFPCMRVRADSSDLKSQPAPSKPVLFKGGTIITLDPSHPNAKAGLVDQAGDP